MCLIFNKFNWTVLTKQKSSHVLNISFLFYYWSLLIKLLHKMLFKNGIRTKIALGSLFFYSSKMLAFISKKFIIMFLNILNN